MQQLKLGAYLERAEEWRQKLGVQKAAEYLRDHVDEFSAEMKLKPLECKRVKKHFEEESAPASSPSPSLPPGTQGVFGGRDGLPRYALLEELGTGATATVSRCVKVNEPSKSYAVKRISLAKLKMQKDFQRMTQVLNREMQILFSLQHPRIVELYDVIEEVDNLYLVMELVKGGEFFDYIVNRGTLTEAGAKNIFLQIVDALKYIHSKDIVYRDLKPENVLVDGKCLAETSLQIKLSDFGHSKLINDGYSTALTRVGTPQYWAPEVSDPRQASRGYDQKVDLWSLGVILYVMLMGAYPFDGVSEPIDRQIQNPRLSFRSPVTGRVPSEAAQDLISSLIRVRPKDRLTLDDCLKHPWIAKSDIQLTPGSDRPTEYCTFHLPVEPKKAQRNQMVQDLLHFQRKFRCFAQVRRDRLIADLSGLSPADAEAAKVDLRGIVRVNLNGVEAMEGTATSLSASLSTVEEGPQYRLETTTIHVGAEGAGIDLIAETCGMRVEGICPHPGQPGLKPGDLITKINEVPLVGAPEAVEQIFGTHFHDGVQIQVKRRAA